MTRQSSFKKFYDRHTDLVGQYFVLNWGLFVWFATKLTCSVFSIDLGSNVSSTFCFQIVVT